MTTLPETTDWRDEPVRMSVPRNGPFPGRRMRALCRLISISGDATALSLACQPLRESASRMFRWQRSAEGGAPSYRQVMAWLEGDGESQVAREALSTMYVFRDSYASPNAGNAYLTDGLQDLGDQIVSDMHEACAAFDDPELWYPGVDEGIEPVSDDHVSRVVAGMQRELRRELRNAQGSRNTPDAAPAAPLGELPWNVQRALVERRRLRFAQWGIGRQQWESNQFSLWDIPDDPSWMPSHVYGDY